ncbi:MAG: Type 1 glutamine amidotransferase-like domain-containing protein [Solirubrobacterales bacterium]
MQTRGRILVSGGHEFNRRSGNDALCDHIVELAGRSHPRICLLPTASGDPEDQIASFRRAFGERDCHPSAVSLFRLGTERVDLRNHLLSQDVIYVGGGSMLNLIAIWAAHEVPELLRECLAEGVLVCGQSAGAMCWFEEGVTSSSGAPAAAAGLGMLEGSACVHYNGEPERRHFYMRAVAEGGMKPGIALDDQAAALFEDGRLVETVSARPGASVWHITHEEDESADGMLAVEKRLESRRLAHRRLATDAAQPDILELRETLAARAAAGRARRSGVGRLD